MASPTHSDACFARGETAEALNRIRNAIAEATYAAECITAGARLGCCDRFQANEALDLGREAFALGALLGAVPAAATDADPSLTTEAKEAA